MIRRMFTWPMLALLSVYRWLLSPLLSYFGVRCRHEPSCSAYSRTAILRHGPWFGGWMTLARLLRCQPWGTSGVDNVPEAITNPKTYAPWRAALWTRTNSD